VKEAQRRQFWPVRNLAKTLPWRPLFTQYALQRFIPWKATEKRVLSAIKRTSDL